MAEAEKKRFKKFNPGGEKGKLHREMGIDENQKIPEDKLRAATHSPDKEKRRDAIRAETMKKWHHGHQKALTPHKKIKESFYGHKG